jgi:hypothetical protein
MNIAPISSVYQVASYMQLRPLVKAVVDSLDRMPKTSLPTEIPGTVQSHARMPAVTLYTQHGEVIRKSAEKGHLIGHA